MILLKAIGIMVLGFFVAGYVGSILGGINDSGAIIMAILYLAGVIAFYGERYFALKREQQ